MLPSARSSWRTLIKPIGVGKLPCAHFKLPRKGFTRTVLQPTSATWMPNTWAVSHAAAPDDHPWQRL